MFIKNLDNICKLLKQNNIEMKGFDHALQLLKFKQFDKFKKTKIFKKYFGRELMYISCIKK